jgi:hypothetical protein
VSSTALAITSHPAGKESTMHPTNRRLIHERITRRTYIEQDDEEDETEQALIIDDDEDDDQDDVDDHA